jgi:SAM-dependent methyltransferase
MNYKKIIDGIDSYYTSKIMEHGCNANGVDWNSFESQYIRFEQLLKIIKNSSFSILDYGCGYGEFLNFLNKRNLDYKYLGYDISQEMISNAKKTFITSEHINFVDYIDKDIVLDYVIASGIFNVKLSLANNNEWQEYIIYTLNEMHRISNKGFSFNALTKYSDRNHMKDYLYYADPLFYFDYCKLNFSRNIVLLHDYDLYEFTILVRKDG